MKEDTPTLTIKQQEEIWQKAKRAGIVTSLKKVSKEFSSFFSPLLREAVEADMGLDLKLPDIEEIRVSEREDRHYAPQVYLRGRMQGGVAGHWAHVFDKGPMEGLILIEKAADFLLDEVEENLTSLTNKLMKAEELRLQEKEQNEQIIASALGTVSRESVTPTVPEEELEMVMARLKASEGENKRLRRCLHELDALLDILVLFAPEEKANRLLYHISRFRKKYRGEDLE